MVLDPYPEVPRPKCFSRSQGTADRTGTTLRVARRNWLSSHIITDVFYILLKEVLNYNVLVLESSSNLTTIDWGPSMEAGVFDFEMESWQAGESTKQYIEYVDQKQVVIAGIIGYEGRSGMYTTPKALQLQLIAGYYRFYGNSALLNTTGYCMFDEEACISTIKEAAKDSYPACTKSESFPFCGESGSDSENYWISPQCTRNPMDCAVAIFAWPGWDTGYFEQLTANHNLMLIHTWVGGNLPAAVEAILAKGKQAVFYWFEPDPFAAAVDARRISFPDYIPGCADGNTREPSGPITCDYEARRLAKLVKAGVRDKAPEAFFLWSNFEIYNAQMKDMLSQTEHAHGDLDSFGVACKYLQEHQALIDQWAPECISRPTLTPTDDDLVFDADSMSCKPVKLFPEIELTQPCFDSRPGKVDRASQTLKIANRGWLSQTLAAYVTSVLLKEFLGYKVIIVDLKDRSTKEWGKDMNSGAFEVDVESWQASPSGHLYQRWVRREKVVLNPGTIGYRGRSGLYVSLIGAGDDVFSSYWRRYTNVSLIDASDYVQYPGAPPLRSLKDALGTEFPACKASWCPTNASEFYGYWVPPQCVSAPQKCFLVVHYSSGFDPGYFEQLTRNLGLHLVFAYYTASMYTEVRAVSNNGTKKVLFYMWEPDPFIVQLRALRVSFPDHSYGCDSDNNGNANTGPVRCDYAGIDLQKLIHERVLRTMPQAYMLLKSFQLTTEDVREMMHVHKDGGGPLNTSFQVACWWAKQNEEKIRRDFAPDCISAPKPTSDLKFKDHVFDFQTLSCPAVGCQNQSGIGWANSSGHFVFDRSLAEECKPCNPGRYAEKHADSKGVGWVCAECPAGKFSSKLYSSSCSSCGPGSFSMNGSRECKNCQKGRFSSSEEATLCVSCSAVLRDSTSEVATRHSDGCVCPAGHFEVESTKSCHPYIALGVFVSPSWLSDSQRTLSVFKRDMQMNYMLSRGNNSIRPLVQVNSLSSALRIQVYMDSTSGRALQCLVNLSIGAGDQVPVHGIIDTYSSEEMSGQLATFSTALDTVLVNSGAPKRSLSDKGQYPFLLRMIPSSSIAGRAIWQYVVHFDVEACAMVYDNTFYGEDLFDVVEAFSKDASKSHVLHGFRKGVSLASLVQKVQQSGFSLVIFAVHSTSLNTLIATLRHTTLWGSDHQLLWSDSAYDFLNDLPLGSHILSLDWASYKVPEGPRGQPQVDPGVDEIVYSPLYPLTGSGLSDKVHHHHMPFFYDALYAYVFAVNELVWRNTEVPKGTTLFHALQNVNFNGLTGKVILNEKGERQMNYPLMYVDSYEGMRRWAKVGELRYEQQELHITAELGWMDGTSSFKAPLSLVGCIPGFILQTAGKCQREVEESEPIIIFLIIALVTILVTSILIICIHKVVKWRRRRLRNSPTDSQTEAGAWTLKWVGSHTYAVLQDVPSGIKRISTRRSKLRALLQKGDSSSTTTSTGSAEPTPVTPSTSNPASKFRSLSCFVNATPFDIVLFNRSGISLLHLNAMSSCKTKISSLHGMRVASTTADEFPEWKRLPAAVDLVIDSSEFSNGYYEGEVARYGLPSSCTGNVLGQLKLVLGPEPCRRYMLLILWSPATELRGMPVAEFKHFLQDVIDHSAVWRCTTSEGNVVQKRPGDGTRNMYDANTNMLKPLAACVDASYAEIHTNFRPAEVFISHVWGETASNTLKSLMDVEEYSVWFCTCCNNQSRVMEELGSDVSISPFARVICSPTCVKVLMISPFLALARKWCTFEFSYAVSVGKDVFMATTSGIVQKGEVAPKVLNDLAARVEDFTVEEATCSSREDAILIDNAISDMGGAEMLDEKLKAAFIEAVKAAHELTSEALERIKAGKEKSAVSRANSARSIYSI